VVQRVKNLPANGGDPDLIPVGKIPWRREWLPTPVFLPGDFQGQRSLVGYSPWGSKELDTTERLTHTHTHTHTFGSTFPLFQHYFPSRDQLFEFLKGPGIHF